MPRRDPQHPTYEFTVPATIEAVPTARRRVVTLARRLGLALSDDLLDTIELLAGEIIANAVLYSGEACEVSVTRTSKSLRVEVTDTNLSLPVATKAEADDESGRGLLLVDALAGSWGAQPSPSGKTTWFEIMSPNSVDTQQTERLAFESTAAGNHHQAA
ncbi:ATP-binding protein [Streptomyces roseirectus]|uniref:ATP-binding protein n=1 Tax=Streptomyces roseirectus TaxID=2768066 RepID=A0A7H0IFI5_9ACTN|nr:ATP-binding protein [Streptomyces roseirectus]QNP71551.1 ATP-binding protein [Streptomyces roseirectus]